MSENLTFIIQDIFNSDPRSDAVEVLNMGMPNAAPENYLLMMQRFLEEFKIDLAVVMIFVGNDITQAHPDFTTKILIFNVGDSLRSPFMIGLNREYSYAIRFIRFLKRFVRQVTAADNDGTFTRENYLEIELQRSAIYRKQQDEFIRAGYSELKSTILAMAQEAASKGVGFMVVLAPDELQVNVDLRQQLFQRYNLDKSAYDFDLPQRLITPELEKNGIPILDLLPKLKEAADKKPVYLKRDTHWNRDGNSLAAREIYNFLLSRELLHPATGTFKESTAP